MTTVAHLAVIIVDAGEVNAYKQLYKIEKNAGLLMRTGDEKSTIDFYLFHGIKNASELKQVLKSIKGVQQLSLISFSNPITSLELSDIRKLLFQNKMDANGISDIELSMFLKSALKGDFMYALYPEEKQNSVGSSILRLKHISELNKNFTEDANTKILEIKRWEGDIEISEVTIIDSVEEPEPPPPPPDTISR